MVGNRPSSNGTRPKMPMRAFLMGSAVALPLSGESASKARGPFERQALRCGAATRSTASQPRAIGAGLGRQCTALHPTGRKELYTFWVNDYAFNRNAGFRMDILLLSPVLLQRLVACGVDAEYRGRRSPATTRPCGSSCEAKSATTPPWRSNG